MLEVEQHAPALASRPVANIRDKCTPTSAVIPNMAASRGHTRKKNIQTHASQSARPNRHASAHTTTDDVPLLSRKEWLVIMCSLLAMGNGDISCAQAGIVPMPCALLPEIGGWKWPKAARRPRTSPPHCCIANATSWRLLCTRTICEGASLGPLPRGPNERAGIERGDVLHTPHGATAWHTLARAAFHAPLALDGVL